MEVLKDCKAFKGIGRRMKGGPKLVHGSAEFDEDKGQQLSVFN